MLIKEEIEMTKSTKKYLFFAICFISMMFLFTNRVKASITQAPDIEQIIKNKELRIAIPAEDVTAFYEEDEKGNLSGIEIDVARGIAEALGVEPKFIRFEGSFDNMTEALNNKEVDIIIGTYSKSCERAKYIDFSEPYFTNNFSIMVNKKAMVAAKINSNPIPYMKNNNVKISVHGGTSHVDIAKQLFPKATIVETQTYEEAEEMVKKGEVFASFSLELEFYLRYLTDPDYSLYVTTYYFNDIKDEFVVAINSDCTALKNFINVYLDTMQPLTSEDIKERYNELYKKQKY